MLSLVETNSPKTFNYSEVDLTKTFENLERSEEAKAYLNRRFGGKAPLHRFGFCPEKNAIVMANRGLNQKLRGIKYRSIDDDSDFRFSAEPGSFSGFFLVKGKPEQVLICEGEFDAFSAKVMGFKGQVVALQTNRVTAKARTELEEILNAAEKIYVCPDRDEAGKELLETLKSLKFQHGKIAPIIPPADFKDLSEFLEGTGIENAATAFEGLLLAAKSEKEQLDLKAVDAIDDAIAYLKNTELRRGWQTGFALLDQKLGGGLMPHTLTALSAPGKTGKTTFIIQLIANLIRQNVKVGFITLEMDPKVHVVPSLFSILLGQNVRDMERDKIDLNLFGEKLKCFENLMFLRKYGSTPSDIIDSWIRDKAAEGFQVFFFDHVGYSLKDLTDIAEHSALSKRLRAITRELPINVFVVVQPKNLMRDQKHVTKHDLYGSVTWSQDINELLTLERAEGNKSLVRLTDSHNPMAETGNDAVVLEYHKENCSLTH